MHTNFAYYSNLTVHDVIPVLLLGYNNAIKVLHEKNFTIKLFQILQSHFLIHTRILRTLTNFHGIDLSALRGAALEEYFKQPIQVRALLNSAYCYALSSAPIFFRTHLMFGS